MKPVDYILIGIILLAVVGAVLLMVKRRKSGCCGCGDGCSGSCSGGCCGNSEGSKCSDVNCKTESGCHKCGRKENNKD